jgi:hypothetical protein
VHRVTPLSQKESGFDAKVSAGGFELAEQGVDHLRIIGEAHVRAAQRYCPVALVAASGRAARRDHPVIGAPQRNSLDRRLGGEVRIEDVPWWLLGVQVGVAVIYETVLIAWWGTTVGKWALGMRVVRYADGKRPDVTRASQRSLLPNMFAAVPIAFVSLLQWVVYGSSATHPLRRGWHDRYAGTLVVRSR